jgi:uncharacterized protein with GYD domain
MMDANNTNLVAVVEAPDASMTALGLGTGKLGNVRTHALRAFSAADIKTFSAKISFERAAISRQRSGAAPSG